MTNAPQLAEFIIKSHYLKVPPVEIFEVLRNYQITLTFDTFSCQETLARLLPQEKSAVINLYQSESTIRYTAAFILGAYLLHRETLINDSHKHTLVAKPYLSHTYLPFKDAELFAMTLLTPDFSSPKDNKELYILSHKYLLSTSCIEARTFVEEFTLAFMAGKYQATKALPQYPLTSYPISLEPVLNSLGLDLSYSETLEEKTLGVLVGKQIVVSKKLSKERQRLAKAFLISKVIDGVENFQLYKEPLFSCERFMSKGYSFAGHLLISPDIPPTLSSKKIAKKYQVPVDLVDFIKEGERYVVD